MIRALIASIIKALLFFIFTCCSTFCDAQKLINLVLVDDKGVTEDVKQAKYIIAIKTYGDTLFERLEYKMSGPLIKRISYKDSKMGTKDGPYAEYTPEGFISSDGMYSNNKKNGKWYQYGDSAKAKFQYTYQDDQLITMIDLDSSEKAAKNSPRDSNNIEAIYKGGEGVYLKQLQKKIQQAVDADKFKRSGYVRIKFIVTTSGKMEEFNITKSTEFLFDEQCLTIMRSISNDWIPASQHGRLVKAYREQPISFTIEE